MVHEEDSHLPSGQSGPGTGRLHSFRDPHLHQAGLLGIGGGEGGEEAEVPSPPLVICSPTTCLDQVKPPDATELFQISVAQSAKQLPSDWEEPAPEVATNNRRHTGSTQKVHCTHRMCSAHTRGANRRCSAHTRSAQKVHCTHKECTVHRARATRVEKAGPWSGDTATCGADPRYDARVPQCSGARATLVHQLAKLRWIQWPCLV